MYFNFCIERVETRSEMIICEKIVGKYLRDDTGKHSVKIPVKIQQHCTHCEELGLPVSCDVNGYGTKVGNDDHVNDDDHITMAMIGVTNLMIMIILITSIVKIIKDGYLSQAKDICVFMFMKKPFSVS